MNSTFWLIASLVVALPGYAADFSGNHAFRGNAFALSGASKTADGSAGVAGTSGAASVSIPIVVPPGTGGLAPALSLNYSSDQGDGPFGLGWNLQLGEIRCTARFGVPEDYADCADFELDGQLLVGPDTRPGMEGRYHTQVETFQRIVLKGSGGGAYWEVTFPGGTRRLYGETDDSKIRSNGHDTPSTAPIARWLLSKIVDLHGNEILITYDRADVGVAYPSTITYALGARTVTFLYESRPDVILDFPGGIPRNITQRLREIEVKSLDTIFSRLLITYSTPGDYSTHRSRIVSTRLFGKDCDDPDPLARCPSMPAQTYEYTETAVNGANPYWEMAPSGGWAEAGLFIETGAQTYTWDLGKRLADVNGDGLPDLLISHCALAMSPCEDPGEGPVVYINDGSGWVYDDAWTTAIDSLTYEVPTIIVESAPYGGGEYARACNATPGEPVTRRISFATDASDWMPIAVNGNLETFTPWPSWLLIDVNGDGFADLVTSIRGGVVALEFDCAGNPRVPGADEPGSVFGGELAQKIFLNNGTGWDPAPAGMAESLPPFQTQTIVKHMADYDGFIWNWALDCDSSGFLGGDPEPGVAEYCTTYMDLQPRFVELNGDGLLDIIILQPDEYGAEPLWLDDFYSTGGWWVGSTSESIALIQNADGSGWTPAPDFDLPFPHIQYNWIPDRSASGYSNGGMQAYDSGVYFVDLNRDGLTDIVKDDSEDNGSSPAAVILGTGTGWCNDLGEWFSSACDTDTDATHSRYMPPSAFNQYTENYNDEAISVSEQLVFVDLNGDGFVDLLQGKDGIQGNPDTLKAWLHDPSAPPHPDNNNKPWVWVEESGDFKPPTAFYPGTQFADLDGNGTADILHGWRFFISDDDDWTIDDAYLSPGTYSDLLASVDNGRGGITDFTYVSAAFQRNAAMESEAEAHASSSLGDADGNSAAVTRFTPKPVISSQAVSGVGIASNVTTRYRYGRPRFDPVERSVLGFGLIEATNPDNSSVDVYYYQREGLVGRLSARKTFDEGGNQIHYSGQSWVLASNPGSIPGAMAAVDVARLELRESYNVYGQDEFGPSEKEVFYYDDSYGYNFLSETTSFRATARLSTTFTPDVEGFDENKWLVGRIGEKKQHNGAITYSRETYDYTTDGQLEARHRDIGLRDGTAASDVATTSWTYDSWGNATSQRDTRGGGESDRVVEFCYDGDGGGNSWCPSIPGGAPDTHSLRVGLKDEIGGVTELEYDWVTGIVLHVERLNESGNFRDSMTVVRDAFGRSKEQWFRGASFGGGDPDVLLSTTIYHDAPAGSTPAYVEQFQFTGEAGEAPIRSARYIDGFGNAFREVAETPSGYRGTAVFRDPVAGAVRSVGPIDCGSDVACSNISETTEPAMVQEVDAAGRVIRITSPDGQLAQLYSWMLRAQPAGFGTGDVFDTVEITDPNNNTTRRLMDGNRVVWVDECQDSGCASFDSTFYTYEATGEISRIYDALANDPANPDYTSPERYLGYEYDTLGRVARSVEPNTGPSYAEYDHQGNVISATNVRGRTTDTYYDALGRILKIDRLAGVDDPPAGVGEWDLTFKYDHPTSRHRTEVYNDEPVSTSSYYRDAWQYDDYGNVTQQVRMYLNETLVMDFKDYDLLGRPARIDYPSENSSASYAYDGAYLTKVCRGPDATICDAEKLWISDVQYDGLGRRESTVTLEGTLTHEYYGTDSESGRFVNALKRVAVTAGYRRLVDENYRYDALGQVTNLDDQQNWNHRDDSAVYTYDSRSRLESWVNAKGIKKWYTYDKLGNLTGHGVDSEGGTNQTFATVDSTKPHQITLNRRMEDYEYDADGNVIRRWLTHFVYDSANRLVCTGTNVGLCDGPAYRYDADGQLMYDGETQKLLMGELFEWRRYWGNAAYSNLVAFGEVIGQARQDDATLREVADPSAWWLPNLKGPVLWLLASAGGLCLLALLAWLGAGAAFGEHPATATLAFVLSALLIAPPTARGMGASQPPLSGDDQSVSLFFRNHQGSLVFSTSPGGRQAYEPFGKARYSRGRREFTSKQFHFATSMYYFGARWYDAEAGRFAGVDPLVANARGPQDLNAYSYVRNDPVNLVDPFGREACPPKYTGGCTTSYGSRPNYSITLASTTIGGHRSGIPVIAPGAPVATGIADPLGEGEGGGDGSSDGSSFGDGLKREVEELEDQIAELEALVDALQDIYDSLDNELQNLKDTLEIPNDFLGLYREIKGEDSDWAQTFQESYEWTKFVYEVKMNAIARRVDSHDNEIQRMRTRKRFFENTLGID